jgi:phosphoribosylamine---glycine ligase
VFLHPNRRQKNLLIIGSGGREHALGWKLHQSDCISEIFYCPGNGGTEKNIQIDYSDFDKIMKFADQNNCETIVGPESPLAKGIVDEFMNRGLRIFGPSRAAAKLESSKAFSKHFMEREGIRTAPFAVFSSYRDAKDYVKSQTGKVVVKADGLASGKGVIVCRTQQQAIRALRTIMLDKKFADAGNQVVIEKRLTGKEVSYIAICDGESVVPLATSKDHKRAYDNDRGANTGGMGSYSPVLDVDRNLEAHIIDDIIDPTIRGMKLLGTPFTGFLYAGLMLDCEDGLPYVLEFNVRMGDPECQALVVRMKSDLYPYMEAAIDRELNHMPPIEWNKDAAVCVVMASKGYPGKHKGNQEIYGLNSCASHNVSIFHSGTKNAPMNRLLTAGGRVLSVTATGRDIDSARKKAYKSVLKLGWGPGEEHYRTDIGLVDG